MKIVLIIFIICTCLIGNPLRASNSINDKIVVIGNEPECIAAATLVFSVKNADWSTITAYLNSDGDVRTGYKSNAAWGFNTMYKCPIISQKMQMRGLNLSRQNDDTIVINALLIFDVDASQKNRPLYTTYNL